MNHIIKFVVIGLMLGCVNQVCAQGSGSSKIAVSINNAGDRLNIAYVPLDSIGLVAEHLHEVKTLLGRAVFEFPESTHGYVARITFPDCTNSESVAKRITLLVFPGDNIKIGGTMMPMYLEAFVEGSPIYKSFLEHRSRRFKNMEVMTAETQQKITDMESKQASAETIKPLKELLASYSSEINRVKYEYIVTNPAQELSALYFMEQIVPATQMIDIYGMFSSNLREGRVAVMLDRQLEIYKAAAAKEKARVALGVGTMAPDFALLDLNERKFQLSSLRGKYVVLDFWGSWCGWCMKDMVNLKVAYAKYKDRIEVVGIDCRETEKHWRESVARESLPWTNLFNGTEDDVLKLYKVEGFPTKIIISPEGKIVGIFVGDGAEFYQELEKILEHK